MRINHLNYRNLTPKIVIALILQHANEMLIAHPRCFRPKENDGTEKLPGKKREGDPIRKQSDIRGDLFPGIFLFPGEQKTGAPR